MASDRAEQRSRKKPLFIPRCPPAAPTRTPAHPFSPVGLSPRQLQQDRAAFHPQRAGQGCTNAARGVTSCGQRPAETREGNRRGQRTDGSSGRRRKTRRSCSTFRASPGNASRVGCPVPRAGLAQRRLANEPGGRDRLASSAEHKAKSAAGAAEGWRSLSPGWHRVPPESAGTTGTGSVPLPRCPCHQGDRCQRHRDPRLAPPLPGPWQWPSPAAHLPLPWAGGLRAPPPERSRTRSCSARCAVPRGRFLPTVPCGWRSRPAPAGSAARPARPCLPAPLGSAGLGWAGLG